MREYRPREFEYCIEHVNQFAGDWRTHDLLAQLLAAVHQLGGSDKARARDFAPWLPAPKDAKTLRPIKIDAGSIDYG